MIKNYFKVAIRNLLKRKGFTLINIFGLATGVAVCLLIVLFIQSELSFDKFHENGRHIFRVVLERRYPGRSTSYSIIPHSIGEAIQKEFPEVKQSVRLFNGGGNGNIFFKIDDKIFEEKNVLFADSNFFRVFSVAMLQGNADKALEQPNSVVLTETTAKKYFGSTRNAINKSLVVDNGSFMVTGICKDWPDNSHFNFTVLVSSNTLDNLRQPNYISFSAHTYLFLTPQADPSKLEAKFSQVLEKYIAGEVQRQFGVPYKEFQASGNGYRYYLQPLTKIHLISDLEAELRPNGSIKGVYIFSVIALFILLLACINFINLSTARSLERAREVGIRKTFGSGRRALIGQFLIESVLISILSTILAIIFVILLLPLFNQLSGKQLTAFYFLQPIQILALLMLSIIVGLISGIYPAFVLSSFRPISILKGKFSSNKKSLVLRNGLVVFQFSISVILIICTLIVSKQMKFMNSDKLGFNKDQVIVVERTDLLNEQADAFKNELFKIPGVQKVTGTSAMPGQPNFFGISFQAVGAKEPMTGRAVITDDQYLSTLNLQMAQGRFFSKQLATDSLSLVINEKAVAELGLKQPVGARLTTPDGQLNLPDGTPHIYTVIGVVKDFHFQSLHQKITPLVFINSSKFGNINPVMAVRIEAPEFKTAVTGIEKTWKRFVSQRPFHYNFLDEQLANLYHSEKNSQRLFSIFSALAIFIACMGLLGLVTYAIQQRVREIGIRKVLGAGIGSIITMLSKDFLKLIFIAIIISTPLAWWAMHKWLQDFAYRITINWGVFVIAGVVALLIALFTVSLQAIKAAVANPVKSLRME